MHEMRLEFRSAKPDRRAALRSEYEKLSAQGDSLLADLTRAGTAAYLAAPRAIRSCEFFGRCRLLADRH